jgi:hypothetical protein
MNTRARARAVVPASLPKVAFVVLAVAVGAAGVVSLVPATFATLQLVLVFNAPRPLECPQLIALYLGLLTLPVSCFYCLNMAVDRFRESMLGFAYLWFILPVVNLAVIAASLAFPPCGAVQR